MNISPNRIASLTALSMALIFSACERGGGTDTSQEQDSQTQTYGAPDRGADEDADGIQVTVQQPAPQVTIEQPAPRVTVEVPEPTVSVEQPKPEVDVQQGQPQVDFQRRGEPQIQIQQEGQSEQQSAPQQEAQPDPAAR